METAAFFSSPPVADENRRRSWLGFIDASLGNRLDSPAVSTASPFAPSGFFALRTPLLPLSVAMEWSDGLSAARAAESLDSAIAADRQTLRTRLAGYVKRAEVREALFVASPSLEESVDVWLQDPDSDRGQRAERSLVRYFLRMASRPTPFGLFAGCSVGRLATETRLWIPRVLDCRRHTRLDMGYVSALSDTLARDAALRLAFTYRPNSSLYRVAGGVRYVASRVNGGRSFHLVAVEPSEALDATLARAESGALIEGLATALVERGVSRADADEYIAELIDNQILVPDSGARITGDDPALALVKELQARPEASRQACVLADVADDLAGIDAAGLGVSPGRYRAVAAKLESLGQAIDRSRLFQVDLVKPAGDLVLGRAVVDEIAVGVELLRLLARPTQDDPLSRFREKFLARYDAREVALVEALDEEAGIGFDGATETSPLLNGLTFPPDRSDSVRWGAREDVMLRLLAEAAREGRDAVVLTDAIVKQLAVSDPQPLPAAFAVMASLAARSEKALARGEFRIALGGVHGPSGALLLGRFCHADEALRGCVNDHLRAEEALDPEATFAEIVHLPEGRLGNLLQRPVLREHEIVYLGRSGAVHERQISITDLMVSVVDDQVVLRSARLGRRVFPRLTTAHNYDGASLGIYRFLCALQTQGVVTRAAWDWGPLSSAPFLPRVTRGRLVLSRARWRVARDEIQRLRAADTVARFREAQAWRTNRRLPQWVVLADGDNTLLIDLTNILALESFVHLVKDRDEIFLEELLPGPDELCTYSAEGGFTHEMVVPFITAPRTAAARQAPLSTGSVPPIVRSFPPWSEWLYLKVYTGTATADEVLRDAIGPVVRKLARSNAADRWFFVRYDDPAHHLRVRFHGTPTTLRRTVWPALQKELQPFLPDRRIWRLALDTYEREVERYGGPEGIELAEALFHADSDLALDILDQLAPGDRGLDQRWRLTLRGIDLLLVSFGMDLAAKQTVIAQARSTFEREFRVDRTLRRQIGARFRLERGALARLLSWTPETGDSLAPGCRALAARSTRLRGIVDELLAQERAGRLSRPLNQWVASVVHMHVNRLVRGLPRQHEFVLYEFLARLYASEAHRD
jgi:thiopeptide-type bacteriocin biosynthesis protein